MSDSPLPQTDFDELINQILNTPSINMSVQSRTVQNSMAVDSEDGQQWASAGNVNRAHMELALTPPNLNDADMLGSNVNFIEYAPGHRPSSAASWSSLSQEQAFSPNQSLTSETSSDVDSSPLQLFTDRFINVNHSNRNHAPTLNSLIPSAFPSPTVYNASVHPSPTISQAQSFTCSVCWKKYKTKNNLQRHRRDALHGPATPSPLFSNASPGVFDSSGHSSPIIPLFQDRKLYECPHPDCPRKGENGFPRKDNMIQHQRLVHNANLPKRQRRKGVQNSGIAKK
ncbi:hypothetical protein EV426DRAFT_704157 [Tirmania nivea]|nr:hypothetical protein EV426DRAFT_704157 [Tirmania nivea]